MTKPLDIDEAASLIRSYAETRDAALTGDRHRCEAWLERYKLAAERMAERMREDLR